MFKTKKTSSFATFPALFDDVNGVNAGDVVVSEQLEGGAAILRANPNITFEQDTIVSPFTSEGARLVNVDFETPVLTSVAGVLTIDVSEGVLFEFEHDEDITLAFTNLPADRPIVITLLRIKDNTATPREIDWVGSVPDFDNVPAELTQDAEGKDMISLKTRDGGVTFFVSTVFDLRQA